jgi:hypothetical protein
MRRRLTRSSESCSVISASFVFWAITCIGAAQPRSGHTPTSEGDAKHGVGWEMRELTILRGLRCLHGARVRGKRQWGEEGGNGVVRDLGVLIKSGVDGRSPAGVGQSRGREDKRGRLFVWNFEFWKHAWFRLQKVLFIVYYVCNILHWIPLHY